MIPHVLSVFVVQMRKLKKKKLYSLWSDPMRTIISLSYSTDLKVPSTTETHSTLLRDSDKK